MKETYNMYKGQVKAKVGGGSEDVSDYRHARNVVDGRLKVRRNETLETFQFRNLKQQAGEMLAAFLHRCEVGVSCCGFNEGDRDHHIRDQVVFGTTNSQVREKALLENQSLEELMKK